MFAFDLKALCAAIGAALVTWTSAAASPACSTNSVCLDFNDNALPAGWNYYYLQGSPGTNVQIQNGRLETGQVDTYGGIYTKLNSAATDKQITVEWDGNIAPVYWGQFTSSMLLSGVSGNHLLDRKPYIQAYGAKTGFGSDVMNFGINMVPADGNGVVLTNTGQISPPQYGAYHYVSKFSNGLASLTAIGIDSNNKSFTYKSGDIAISDFKLADLPYVGLLSATTTGQSAWIDNVKITEVQGTKPTAPTVAQLATMSSIAYSNFNSTKNIGKVYDFGKAVDYRQSEDGFSATVFQNNDGSLVVAIRGTDLNHGLGTTLYNLLADGSFAKNVDASNLMISYIKQIKSLLEDIHKNFPDSQVTLTGHSLGGALAELAGNAAGLSVVSFDAPGAKVLLASQSVKDIKLDSLADLKIPTPNTDIFNYRLELDQISMVGKGIFSDDHFGSPVTVSNPLADTSALNFLKNHNLDLLKDQISALCPNGVSTGVAGCISGYSAKDINLTIGLTRFIPVLCAAKGIVATEANNLVAGLAAFIECGENTVTILADEKLHKRFDPAPGFDYIHMQESGSPYISRLDLPILASIAGWSVKYHDQLGWSEYRSKIGDGSFDFGNGVDGVEFSPIDSNGKKTYNSEFFAYDLTYATAGTVVAQSVVVRPLSSNVPEPAGLALSGIALAALAASRLCRQSSRLA